MSPKKRPGNPRTLKATDVFCQGTDHSQNRIYTFSVLVAKEIDDIGRFRDEKKLCAYAGLVPSTYASGGKVFHGRFTKTGNKWLRWAFIEAVQSAISCDAELFAYYERLKMKKGANAVKVATACRLLTIVYRVLSQERLYERRNRRAIRRLAPAALSSS